MEGLEPDYRPRAPEGGRPGTEAPSLLDLMRMTLEDWDLFTRGSAMRRAGYDGFRRSALVALGNYGATSLEAADRVGPVLDRAAEDGSELVREHAEWGLRRIMDAP